MNLFLVLEMNKQNVVMSHLIPSLWIQLFVNCFKIKMHVYGTNTGCSSSLSDENLISGVLVTIMVIGTV